MSESGLGKLAGSVSKEMNEDNKVQKVTSNDMFKGALMGFINKEMENIDDNNIDVLTEQQNLVNQKIFELMDEDSLDASEVMRFSDMLSNQKNREASHKVSKIGVLFDILRPTKDSANPLLNNERNESESNVSSEMSPQELQVLLKVTQMMQTAKSSSKEEE